MAAVGPAGSGPSGKMIAVRASLAVVAVVVLAAARGSGGQKVYAQGAYKPKQVVLGVTIRLQPAWLRRWAVLDSNQ